MLARQHRFHGHNSLRFVYQKGDIVRGAECSLRFMRNPRRESFRAAVVVGKKVNKSAVARNRIRRRVFEVIRRLEISEPWDFVFLVYDGSLGTVDAVRLEEIVRTLFVRAHIIQDSRH